MYYFEILDCDKEVTSVYKYGALPRFTTEIHATTEGGNNEFSFEDIGSMRLYVILFLLTGTIFVMMIKTYMRYYR